MCGVRGVGTCVDEIKADTEMCLQFFEHFSMHFKHQAVNNEEVSVSSTKFQNP